MLMLGLLVGLILVFLGICEILYRSLNKPK